MKKVKKLRYVYLLVRLIVDAHLLSYCEVAVHGKIGWESRFFNLFLLLKGRVKAGVRNLLDIRSRHCTHCLISI